MTSAVGLSLFAAVQPLGIVAYIVILTRGGRRDAWGFVIGWFLCACLVAVLTVVLAGGTQKHDSSSTIGSAGLLQIALGVAALGLLVVRRTRAKRRADALDENAAGAVEEPEAAARDENAGPVAAAAVGALVQGWPIVAAAVAAVLDATDSHAGRVFGIVLVVVLSTSTYLSAQILSGRHPEATGARLEALRHRIETHRDAVIDVLLLGAGLWLVLHGVSVELAK